MKKDNNINIVVFLILTVLTLFTLTACSSATGSKPTMVVNQNSNITQPVTVQPTETKYLTRAEAMSLLYKTLNPDTKPTEDSDFTAQVGTTEYNLYAQEYKGDTYLNTSENKNTYNSTMSRGEAIYLLMNRFYAEELDTYKADNVKLEDAEDKGEETGRTRIEELSEMLNNPKAGVEHSMYKSIALAYEKGILDTAKTRWNEGITKAELLEYLIKVEAEFNKAGVVKNGYSLEEVAETEEETDDDNEMTGNNIEKPDSGYWFPDKADESNFNNKKVDKVQIVEKLNKVMVTKAYLDLREKDTTSSDTLGDIEAGVEVKVTGKTSNNWYEVNFADRTGYIDSSLLEDIKAETKANTQVIAKKADKKDKLDKKKKVETKKPVKNTDNQSLTANKKDNKVDSKVETPKKAETKVDTPNKTDNKGLANNKKDKKAESKVDKKSGKKADNKKKDYPNLSNPNIGEPEIEATGDHTDGSWAQLDDWDGED